MTQREYFITEMLKYTDDGMSMEELGLIAQQVAQLLSDGE